MGEVRKYQLERLCAYRGVVGVLGRGGVEAEVQQSMERANELRQSEANLLDAAIALVDKAEALEEAGDDGLHLVARLGERNEEGDEVEIAERQVPVAEGA